MKQALNYNIHNLVKFRIIRDKKWDFRDLINLKFAAFQVDEIDRPDIILKIGKFTPSNQDCYVVDYKYYIKDNYFYCHDSEGQASWEVEVKGIEQGDTVINFSLHRRFQTQPINIIYMPLFLPQAFLARMIEHKLSTKGCLLAHSGAIARDGHAYLLSGRGGCFKTTLCMEFIRQGGFTWLGDERVILSRDKVLGFPINAAMFDFMTRHLPDETHWGFLKQLQFAAECFVGRCQKTATHKPESAKLKAILLIAKNSGLAADKRVTFSPVPQPQVGQTVDKLITSSRLEDFKSMAGFGLYSGFFLKYMLAYTFAFPNSSVALQEERLREHLRENLQSIPVYEVEIPPTYSPIIFEQIHNFIVKNY
jgi:hypothetical protein